MSPAEPRAAPRVPPAVAAIAAAAAGPTPPLVTAVTAAAATRQGCIRGAMLALPPARPHQEQPPQLGIGSARRAPWDSRGVRGAAGRGAGKGATDAVQATAAPRRASSMQREEQRAGGWPRRRSALPHPPDLALFPAPTPPRGRVPPPASLLPPPLRVTLPATCLLHEGGGARGDAFVATATAADSMEARGPCGVAVAACAAVAAIGGGGSSPLGRHDAGSAIAAWRTRVCWRVLLPPHAPYPACSLFHSTPTRHTTGLPLALCRPQPGGRHGSAGAMEGGGGRPRHALMAFLRVSPPSLPRSDHTSWPPSKLSSSIPWRACRASKLVPPVTACSAAFSHLHDAASSPPTPSAVRPSRRPAPCRGASFFVLVPPRQTAAVVRAVPLVVPCPQTLDRGSGGGGASPRFCVSPRASHQVSVVDRD